MKLSQRLVLPAAALFVLGACQVSPHSLAADAKPVPASLADRLPGDTIAYISLPDIPAMRRDMQKSSLARMLAEPDMQNFLGDLLGMLDLAWSEIREMAAAEGVPDALTHWEALRSFEAGLSLRADPNAAHLFKQPPHAFGIARLGLADGLGPIAFQVLAAELADESVIVRGPGGSSVLILEEDADGLLVRAVLSCTSDAVEIEFSMGTRGEGSLAATENFRRAWNRNMSEGAAFFGFLRIDQILSTLMDGLGDEQPEIAAMVLPFFQQCIAPIQSVSFASGWSDEGSFMNTLLDLGDQAGAQWKPVTADKTLAAYVPENAASFSIKGADSDPWMQSMLDLLDRAALMQPEGMPMPLGQLMQMQAPEVHAWLLGPHRPELQKAMLGFGQRSFSYSVPTGPLGSESLSFSELDDAPAMAAVLEQLMPRLRQVLNESGSPVKLEMRRVKREVKQPDGSVTEVPGPAYYWIDFELPEQVAQVMAMIQLQLQPAIGVAPEGWMVMSISKSSVAAVLRSGMQKPERDIRNNQEAAGFLAHLPRSATSAAWSDPRPATAAALGMVSGMLPMLGSMAGGELPIPVNLSAFPSPDTFVRNMRTTESWAWPLRGDFMSRSVGTMQLADLFTALAAAIAIGPPLFMAVQGSEVLDFVEPGGVEF